MTRWDKLYQAINRDNKLLWTISAYIAVFLVFVNANIVHSPALGIAVSSVFFLINSVFLGSTFFEDKEPFFRFAFGGLLLVAIIGVVGWIVLIIYNLDIIRSTIVLCVVSAISSVVNKLGRYTFSIEFVRDASKV